MYQKETKTVKFECSIFIVVVHHSCGKEKDIETPKLAYGQGKKRCKIQGGSQEMAVIIVRWQKF